MKKMILIFVVILHGCAASKTVEYQWTSNAGKACFYTCKSSGAECMSQCNDGKCRYSCNLSVDYCIKACPDIIEH